MDDELWKSYKDKERYNVEDRYEIAIVDPARNNYLVGFWARRYSVPKGCWGFCTDTPFAEEFKKDVDRQLKNSRDLKRFLKKNGYKAVRVKIEKNILFNEMN